MTHTDTLPPLSVRVLFAVLRMAQAGQPVTWRALCAAVGAKSTNHVAEPMERLREAGLLTWERGVGKKATIRPTCRMLIYGEAGS